MTADKRIRLGSRVGLAMLLIAAGSLLLTCLWESQWAARAWYFGAYVGLHISLGCAALLFIGDLTGGRWNEELEPLLNAGRRMIFWMVPLIGIPLLWLGDLYPWTSNTGPTGSLFPLSKEEYLSPAFFVLRMAGYGIAFILLSFGAGVSASNIRKRREGSIQPSVAWSSGGLVLYAFINLLFQTDAVMSLDPHWFSTGFPVVMMSSQTLTAYCLCLFCRSALHRPVEAEEPFFGNLVLATLLFWLYVAFVQFLIIWMGNLTEDIGYYLQRSTPFWRVVTGLLFVFSFVLPLLLLLRREVKCRAAPLAAVACLLTICQLVYLCWAILPSWESLNLYGGILCGIAALGASGLWLFRVLPIYAKEASHG